MTITTCTRHYKGYRILEITDVASGERKFSVRHYDYDYRVDDMFTVATLDEAIAEINKRCLDG